MKHTRRWITSVGCVGGILVLLLSTQRHEGMTAIAEAAWGKEDATKTAAAPATQKSQAQVVTTAPGASSGPVDGQAEKEKIVFTFEDDAKMQEFTNLWRQRKGMLVRMSVLQSYFSEEQAALAQLNNKFATAYKLDVTKNYSLDDKRHVLIEREAPAASLPTAPGAQAPAAPASQPTTNTPK